MRLVVGLLRPDFHNEMGLPAPNAYKKSAACSGTTLELRRYMDRILPLALSLIMTTSACKKKQSETPAEPVKASTGSGNASTEATEATLAVPPTPGMDLTALVTTKTVGAPGIMVEVLDAALDLATLKSNFEAFEIVEAKESSSEMFVRGKAGEVFVQRKLGSKVVQCSMTDATQAERDAGRSICTALSVVGNAIAMPFKLGTEDTDFQIGDGESSHNVYLKLSRATSDAPADGKSRLEADGWKNTGKILSESKLPDGVSVIIEAHNGDIASQGLIYDAFVRRRLHGIDLVCQGSHVETLDQAKQAAAACGVFR